MSNVYLDRYSSQMLRVKSSLEAVLGDRILHSFTPLHFGIFSGLSTRIVYVFVDLSPLIFLITGFFIRRYRR